MKFGKIDNPEVVDFVLPPDNKDNKLVLEKSKKGRPEIFIGCAKWNKADLKNFYPKGTKDELAYYATQFNSIELNATFYNNFPLETIDSWHTKTPEGFRFFPKLHQGISHWKRLKDAEQPTSVYLDHISHLEEKLGMLFLQMPDNFGPKNWEVLRDYLEVWSSGFPLALELRHTAWYDGSWDNSPLYEQLEKKNITHIITDTAGRRDLLHMRLTTPTAFIRYNGANVDSDYSRLDDWLDRLKLWVNQGIENIYFFVHQNHEEASPLLSAYLIEKVNKEFGTEIKIPHTPGIPTKKGNSDQIGLF
ncbi:Uncharacterized conserved protein YecE, DUF72 family [Dyadobacter koreensis]|uniref:Uncharacterized conserved protein YecE, DUF72 family n=1 Tax=Dyadobacter koreensis TaxID=408657 RepID=A0A1H6X801_9BACT|nr:DUF72 domain-containing protein [Dyadobacter koreensis]SEJ20675.1 Uncharacterized conserved protein YecE, DUF72 family [Dyadobacter koreensis]